MGGPDKTNIKVDLVSGELGESDTLLLCSDGLSGEITSDCIAIILFETTGNQARVVRLIAAVLEARGKDNVTVIVLSTIEKLARNVRRKLDKLRTTVNFRKIKLRCQSQEI